MIDSYQLQLGKHLLWNESDMCSKQFCILPVKSACTQKFSQVTVAKFFQNLASNYALTWNFQTISNKTRSSKPTIVRMTKFLRSKFHVHQIQLVRNELYYISRGWQWRRHQALNIKPKSKKFTEVYWCIITSIIKSMM